MSTTTETVALERLLRPLPRKLSVELARALVALRADASVQARYEDLAERRRERQLTEVETNELESMVRANTLLGFLKAEAHAVLNGRSRR